jgi:hypothetical protein
MEETLILSTVLEKQTRQIFANVFFLRRNHIKTIGRTVHASFSSYNSCAIHNHSTQNVFFHIISDSLVSLYFSRSNFVERGNYRLLSHIRNCLSVTEHAASRNHLHITPQLNHHLICIIPPHTHTPHLPFKASFQHHPSIHVYASQMVPRYSLFN